MTTRAQKQQDKEFLLEFRKKKCSKCGDTKDIDDFSVGQTQCKLCQSKYAKAYNVNNKEKRIVQRKEYRANNREKRNEYNKKWLINNKKKWKDGMEKKKHAQITYFIKDGDAIKIGKTTTLRSRMIMLGTGNPRPLHLIGFVWGDHEEVLHKLFADKKINNEWYKLDESVFK